MTVDQRQQTSPSQGHLQDWSQREDLIWWFICIMGVLGHFLPLAYDTPESIQSAY